MEFMNMLNDAVKEWKKEQIEDADIFINLRGEIDECMTSQEAFENIVPTLNVLLSQNNEHCAIEVIQVLIALAYKSDTTQVPTELKDAKVRIESLFSNYCDYAKQKCDKLFKYYRV